MKLHEIKPAQGATRVQKRVGRGTGSGHGKTSTRGHKGQWARSGGGVRPGFEGGQMPLTRRLPKRGFTNIFKKEIVNVDLEALNQFPDDTVVDVELLFDCGLIRGVKDGVKILANGELTKKLTVQVPTSKSAAEKIVALGGKVEVI